ncbi:MAG: hypothetical protein Q7V31_10990 [Parvibaculum sp.]|uniref:hypothetical protein n=1 Tax=Parvibaculum sp. TaxID=2024848 RepID=UPI00271CF965|nr:hypothetical protein [Parvibaculum sp.]MDO8839444.1 hypothetical protein [Parvibaculum sp.]
MGEDTTSGRDLPPPTGLNTPENIRRLKFVVAGLGALMVLGFLVVVVTIANRASTLGGEERVAAPSGGRFGVSEVAVAPGERVREIVPLDGDRLAVHLASERAESILILHARSGQELGRIHLVPQSGFASRE